MNSRTLTRSNLVLTAASGAVALLVVASALPAFARGNEIPLAISRVYFEYNASANDLGVHVFLDGEDWKSLKISNPDERKIFEVTGKGPYAKLGMTELFFEGAEPSLDDLSLAQLLGMFPEGQYEFEGLTVDDAEIEGEGTLSHAIPAGPIVAATLGAQNHLVIHWSAVTAPPPGFPAKPIVIKGYQVIVGSFQVTLPATALSVTVSPEFVASLAKGEHQFEVLAIEQSGNQTLTEGTFLKP
jgi:hypothetical protein